MSAVKLALPKGRLMAETSALLERAEWGLIMRGRVLTA
jgi:ATP phosphoribosyltransferase